MSAEGGLMLSLDEALDELGMLSNASRYKREYIQDIEAKYERRKAENAKWLKWQSRADIVREEDSNHQSNQISNQINGINTANTPDNRWTGHQQPAVGGSSCGSLPGVSSSLPDHSSSPTSHQHENNSFTNLVQSSNTGGGGVTCDIIQHSTNGQRVIHDPGNTSRTSISIQIKSGAGPYMRRGLSPGPSPIRGPAASAHLPHHTNPLNGDSQFVTNITINQNQSVLRYSNMKLENDSFYRRMQFSPRRTWNYHRQQYSSPYYGRVINLPPSTSPSSACSSSSPYGLPSSTSSPCVAVMSPYNGSHPVLKLSGVLTSFKHRTFRTRPRVRFCVREENTDDLTAQLANIKLDTSSFRLNGNSGHGGSSSSSSSLPIAAAPPPPRRESTPAPGNGTEESAESMRSRLILEPRSRHMSLEPNDSLLRSDLLATSLNHLDLEENSD